MSTSVNLGFNYITESQAEKTTTMNEALAWIDGILNTGIADRDLFDAPAGSEGDLYIVKTGTTPGDDWEGQTNNLALYLNGGWDFLVPNEGMSLWVRDENKFVVYNGSSWEVVGEAQVGQYTKQQGFVEATLTNASVEGGIVEWNLETQQSATITLNSYTNRTLNTPTNMKAGFIYSLRVVQPSAGGKLLSFSTDYKFEGGSYTIGSGSNQVTMLQFYSDGASMYCTTARKY